MNAAGGMNPSTGDRAPFDFAQDVVHLLDARDASKEIPVSSRPWK